MFIYYIFASILVVFLLLLIPFLVKSRDSRFFEGPDLSKFSYEEVSFYNKSEDLKLFGLLFKPTQEEPSHVAIIIHGSGQSFRNNGWYLSVVQKLLDTGITVLLPDKRGSDKSEGDWRTSNIKDLALDTISAVEFIRNQSEFKSSSIGIIGLSQGGWIAPVVASQTTDISFVVSMVGPCVTTDEQLWHEVFCDIEPYTYKFLAKIIANYAYKKVATKPHVKVNLGFDPIPYWKKVKVPVFMAFGENDKNVPVDDSIKRLKDNDLNKFKIKIYPNGEHAIYDVYSNNMSEEFLGDLVVFIQDVKR